MRWAGWCVGVVALVGCGGEGPRDPGQDGSVSIGSLSVGDDETADGAEVTEAGTGAAAADTAVDGSDEAVKFDLAAPDGSAEPPEPMGCTKVDFLFVIDNSNSMATNQGELVASFPEFAAGIVSTLSDVESYHVAVVTSDAYQFNEPGCTAIGASVTQTGGVNSSNSACGPFADGFRYMTEADDLATDFACVGLVGTAGANDELMMAGATAAISPALVGPGGCNDGFLREDALLVTVLISDEDDPGSSQVGSPGDPMTWYDSFVAAKMFPENVVVLTLTRGSPGNTCGAAEGSEVDGARLMQFSALFGANGFEGDICAASFGPFFADAIGVIASACESFMPPPG